MNEQSVDSSVTESSHRKKKHKGNQKEESQEVDDDDIKEEEQQKQSILNLPDIQSCSESSEKEHDYSETVHIAPILKLTPFQRFVNQQKPLLMKKDSSLSQIEVSTQLALQWRALSRKKRQKYDEATQ